MSHLRQVDVRERENIIAAQQQAIAEAKPSAFQIAVSVANAADSKVRSHLALETTALVINVLSSHI
jgi:hypothetical protein